MCLISHTGCEVVDDYLTVQDLVDDKDYYLDIIVEDFTYNTTKTNTYHSLLYETHPRTRVFWSSIDSFTVYHQGFVFRYPIIQYSTYANDLGEGKQMIYIDNTMIGKALTVTGCVSNDVCMNETFIVRK